MLVVLSHFFPTRVSGSIEGLRGICRNADGHDERPEKCQCWKNPRKHREKRHGCSSGSQAFVAAVCSAACVSRFHARLSDGKTSATSKTAYLSRLPASIAPHSLERSIWRPQTGPTSRRSTTSPSSRPSCPASSRAPGTMRCTVSSSRHLRKGKTRPKSVSTLNTDECVANRPLTPPSSSSKSSSEPT